MGASQQQGQLCPMCGGNLRPLNPTGRKVICELCAVVFPVSRTGQPMAPRRPQTWKETPPSERILLVVLASLGLAPALLVTWLFIGAPVAHRLHDRFRTFPVSCNEGEEISVSQDWEGTVPMIGHVDKGCLSVDIKNSKVKAPALYTGREFFFINVTDSTIETTDVMIENTGPDSYLLARNSTLVSQKEVLASGSALILSLTNSTIESRTAVAVRAEGSLRLTSAGGRIDGAAGGIVAGDRTVIEGHDLVVISAKGKAITAGELFELNLTRSKVTSVTDDAILTGDHPRLTFTDSTVEGAKWGIDTPTRADFELTRSTIHGKLGDFGPPLPPPPPPEQPPKSKRHK